MDIDLRLPSGDHDKEGEEPNVDNMLSEVKLRNGDAETGNVVDVAEEILSIEGGDVNSPTPTTFKEDTNLEPLSGMEFESHGAAYSFYQEYARSMGFNTAIQNSRRSKTSREFIDAKFACSRYGTKREYDKSFNRPRSRQTKQDPENGTSRRSCSKTDCKASMHVKRRPDGKWVIHSFVKEHNHGLLPAQAVSEQTRRMYAAMAQQFAEYKNVADRYEEEAKADSETWNKQPSLKSPSPLEKSVSGMYTHAVFKKFQVEVLGVVACHPKMESQDEISVSFRVQDLEKHQDFTRALKLSEEASLSQESYNIAFRALGEVFGNCISMNNSNKSLVEAGTSTTHGLLCIEDDNQNRSMPKTNKKKNQTKKRKVNSEQEITTDGPQDSLQQMDKLSSRAVALEGYYGTQQGVPGMVQLNLMAPTRDNYYSNQQTIQGLGQLNSIAPSHDGYYGTQQSMHGLGQMDFFRTPTGFAYSIRFLEVSTTASFLGRRGRMNIYFVMQQERFFSTEAEISVNNEMWGNIGGVADETRIRDAAAVDSPKRAVVMFEGDVDFEPCDGIEFLSHEESYGVTPDSDSGNGRRSTVKKQIARPACMNVELAEKNNIDILHAISERTRKMYVEMSRQSGGYQNAGFVKSEMNTQFGKGRYLALDEGDAQAGCA
ncbi:hypothetical protein H0E87_027433 [Populus deltoides]|uniref:Protein FAR1-RELATED SEQUENCE n=1 Tax=Populus deltoides TaxID=3696 RepID=A0A8T2X1V2_POPDE|nr:hypothetical protein H0E87_027433 [Populus deltoides]